MLNLGSLAKLEEVPEEKEVEVSVEDLLFLELESTSFDESLKNDLAEMTELRNSVEQLKDLRSHIEAHGISEEFQSLIGDQLDPIAPSFGLGDKDATLAEIDTALEGFIGTLMSKLKGIVVKFKTGIVKIFRTADAIQKKVTAMRAKATGWEGDIESLSKFKLAGVPNEVVLATCEKIMKMKDEPALPPEWNPTSPTPVKEVREKLLAIPVKHKLDDDKNCAIGFNSSKFLYYIKDIGKPSKGGITDFGFTDAEAVLKGVDALFMAFDLQKFYEATMEHEAAYEQAIEDIGIVSQSAKATSANTQTGEVLTVEVKMQNSGFEKVCDMSIEMYMSYFNTGYGFYKSALLMYYAILSYMK